MFNVFSYFLVSRNFLTPKAAAPNNKILSPPSNGIESDDPLESIDTDDSDDSDDTDDSDDSDDSESLDPLSA